MNKKIFFISDIHGCYQEMIDALKKAQDYVRNYEIEVEGKKEKIFSDPKFWTSFILLDGLN